MKVLITGGLGYVGSICSEILLECGHEVVIFDNVSTGFKESLPSKAMLVEGDLLKERDVRKAFEKISPDSVLHFAGLSQLSDSFANPGEYYRSIISGGVHLLESMKDFGCKSIVFPSSCAVYGLPEKMPIDERTPLKPISPYGHAKVMFEQMLAWYGKIHEFKHVSLRFSNASGATSKNGERRMDQGRLISRALLVALGKVEYVPVYGDNHPTPDGTCIRDYVHVSDVAEACSRALESERSGAYNIGTGEGNSVLQVVDLVRKVTNEEVPIRMMPPRKGEAPRVVAACHRAKMDWQWKPKHQRLVDIIETAWEWVQAHPEVHQSDKHATAKKTAK
ncbi:MAG: UDP-glucose 4-epimerase GalE [Verrucomicrobiota bacterium]